MNMIKKILVKLVMLPFFITFCISILLAIVGLLILAPFVKTDQIDNFNNKLDNILTAFKDGKGITKNLRK